MPTILIDMNMNPVANIQAAPTEAAGKPPEASSSGFAETLNKAGSGGPPGPEPPASREAGKGDATKGPNAQSKNLDLPPQSKGKPASKPESNDPAPAPSAGAPVPPVNPELALLSLIPVGQIPIPTVPVAKVAAEPAPPIVPTIQAS